MDPLNTPLADQPRFAAYVDTLAEVLGHADRVAPLKAYCTGLLLPGARKSIEPMAARIAPARVPATHQALHHFVAKGEWSDTAFDSGPRCGSAGDREPRSGPGLDRR